MLHIPNDRLPLAASVRLSPDEHGRQVILLKPDSRRFKFLGVTKMTLDEGGLTPERVAAINRALGAEFIVTLTSADADLTVDVYLDACDLLQSTRAAARAERDAARREPSRPAGGAA